MKSLMLNPAQTTWTEGYRLEIGGFLNSDSHGMGFV